MIESFFISSFYKFDMPFSNSNEDFSLLFITFMFFSRKWLGVPFKSLQAFAKSFCKPFYFFNFYNEILK